MSSQPIYIHIIPKKEAKKLGMIRYFTGKSCKYGHISERFVSNNRCIECSNNSNMSPERKSYRSNRYKENRKRYRNMAKENYRKNRKKRLKYDKIYYNTNKERILKRTKDYYRKNKERIIETSKEYYRNNKHAYIENATRRRVAKLERTIILSKQHEDDMKHIYEQAALLRYLGYDVHVDHIVPLQGELVSGLHVPWNLQIIPAEENLSKGNKFDGLIEIY